MNTLFCFAPHKPFLHPVNCFNLHPLLFFQFSPPSCLGRVSKRQVGCLAGQGQPTTDTDNNHAFLLSSSLHFSTSSQSQNILNHSLPVPFWTLYPDYKLPFMPLVFFFFFVLCCFVLFFPNENISTDASQDVVFFFIELMDHIQTH